MSDFPKADRDDLPEFARRQPSPNVWREERLMEGTLSAKREAFCREYLRDFSILNAYERAGYKAKHSRTNAYRLFKEPDVQQRIAELKKELIESQKLTIQKVCESLERIAVKAEEEGRYSAATRSWELLGKYLGMFIERAQLDVKISKTMEELDDEIERLTKIVGTSNERQETSDSGDS